MRRFAVLLVVVVVLLALAVIIRANVLLRYLATDPVHIFSGG